MNGNATVAQRFDELEQRVAKIAKLQEEQLAAVDKKLDLLLEKLK